MKQPFKPNSEYAKKLTKKQTKEMIYVIKNTPSPNKPNNEWEKIAFLFHNTYEGLAPKFGYETRKDTKEFDPESNNGKLMIATCKAVISKTLQQQREEIIKEIEGIVGVDESERWGDEWSFERGTNVGRNRLRKEIRERLKQITNLKEK